MRETYHAEFFPDNYVQFIMIRSKSTSLLLLKDEITVVFPVCFHANIGDRKTFQVLYECTD